MKILLTTILQITITWGSHPDSPGAESKTIVKTIRQDTIDQIRQEYVDHGISVPARSSFGADRGDAYDNMDDYGYAIHEPARSYHALWSKEFKHDIIITSGYRNPEHNTHHVGGTNDSLHQYGRGFDGGIIDYDGDNSTVDDRQGMIDAAEDINPEPDDVIPYAGHIHVEWE